MRVKVEDVHLDELFSVVYFRYGSWTKVADRYSASVRTLRDWRSGFSSLPVFVFKDLLKIAGREERDLSYRIFPNFWHAKRAGRKGAYARMKKHGNPGTTEGRKRGGIASLAIHRKRQTGFVLPKLIKEPRYSDALAELLGILIGDGHLTNYQVSVTTNSVTDIEHASFVRGLLGSLFGARVAQREKKGERAVDVVVSSVRLVGFLQKLGMPAGNKLRKKLRVPKWILGKQSYATAFVRGLFDTDGCIYLDKHKGNGKLYSHLGWAITSYSKALLYDVRDMLHKLDFSPTHRASQKSVYLRRQGEVRRYFSTIGTHNPKHRRRFEQFIGEVPKWS